MIKQIQKLAFAAVLLTTSILFSYTASAQVTCVDKYAVTVNSSSGTLLFTGNTTTGAADNSGVKFDRGSSGASNTQMTWDMGEVIPSGTVLKVRVKLEHCTNAASGVSNSSLRVCAKDQSTGNFIAQGSGPYNFSNTSYHYYSVTLDRATRYVQVEDLGKCAFRVDNLLWEKCTTPAVCDPTDGTAANGYCAPSPNCTSGNTFTWSQGINPTTGAGLTTRLISSGNLTYTIPTSLYPTAFDSAVTINIDDVVAYDGYSNRVNVTQTNERYRILFKKGGVILLATDYTGDVADQQKQGFWRGALGSDLYFEHGFDEIVFEHYDVVQGYGGPGSVVPSSVCISYSTTPPSTSLLCERKVINTRGCSSTPYVIYLKDNNNVSYNLSGDSTQYTYKEFADGTAKFTAQNLTASGLTGNFDVELTFSGKTTTPLYSSPKNSSCFTTGSTSDWLYYENTTGTITASSSTYGTMQIGRMGPAYQVGNNANITQAGFGGSGWLSITGGTGVLTSGDVNLMLDGCQGDCQDKYALTVASQSGSLLSTSNTTTGAPDGSGVKFDRGNAGATNTQMTWDMGEVIPSGSVITFTVKLEHCVNVGSTSNSILRSYAKDQATGNFVGQGSGNYSFSNTSYNTYTVTLDRDTRFIKIEDMGGCAFRVDAVQWEDCDNVNNTIKGTVFYDADANGLLNGGDNGFPSVTVYLYEDTNGNGVLDAGEQTPVDSTASAANGAYTFIVEYTGGTDNFIMAINESDLPSDTRLTTDNLESASFSSGGQTDDENDFGYIDPNKILGKVFFDENRDGILDPSEVGTSGNVVYLYEDTDGDGVLDPSEQTPIDSVITDANGNYDFLVDYMGGTNAFIVGVNEITLPSGNIVSTPLNQAVEFTSGGNEDEDNNFGFDLENELSGAVYADYNKDGVKDATEPGKEDITVYLYKDANGNGFLDPSERLSPIDSVNTDTAGNYSFVLPYVNGSTEKYFTATDLADYPNDAELTTDNEEDAQFISGGNSDPNNDFGFSEINTIKGTVFYDFDGDGISDAGEPGEQSVTVYLYADANNDGVLDPSEQTPIDSAVTDVNGEYVFKVDYTGGTNSYIMTTDTNDYPGVATLSTDNVETASFTSGSNEDSDNNFGYTTENVISGKVFYDFDKDGLFDLGDEGESAVTVYLYEDVNNNGVLDVSEQTPIDSVNTDANGNYTFTVPYIGGTNSFLLDTDTDDYPNGSMLTTDNLESASFTSGGNTDPNNNFAYSEVNTIAGIVYYDGNVNENLDTGEPRRQGTKVYLFTDANDDGILNPSEQAPIDSAITDINGAYEFEVDYTGGVNSFLVATDLATYPALTSLTTDNLESASFTSGGNSDIDNNFGFIDNNRISGTVFEDNDNDGFNDLAEVGTFDVLVLLYSDANNNGLIDGADAIVDSIRTDANGNYKFDREYTGGTDTYVINIDTTTLPANASLTTDNVETASFTSGGNTDNNNDFGHNGCSTNTGLVGPDNGCALEDQVFAVSPAATSATYTWSYTGNPTVNPSSTAATKLLQWSAAGVYTVKLVVNIPGCVDSFEKAINITRPVNASAAPGDTICRGGSTVLDGTSSTSGVNFDWSIVSGDPGSIDIGASTSQPTVSPFITTVFKMTVTDQLNGCSRVEFVTVDVDVNLNPTANIAAVADVCEGDRLFLDGSGSVAPASNPTGALLEYWFKDEVTFASFTDTTSSIVTDTTDFMLVVYDAVSLCPDTARVTVIPIIRPSASATKIDPTCDFDNGQLVISIIDNPTKTEVEFSIDGGTNWDYTSADNVGTFTISDLAEGVYDIQVRWSNDDCPTDVGSETLVDNTVIPTVDVLSSVNGLLPDGATPSGANASYADLDSVLLNGEDALDLLATTNGSGSFTWTSENGFTGNSMSENITTSAVYADSGFYYVEFTNTDLCVIKDSVFVLVIVENKITGRVYKDVNGNSDFDAIDEVGEDSITVYLYSDVNGNGIIDLAESTPIDSIDTDPAGDYEFTVRYSGGTDNFLMTTDRLDYTEKSFYSEASDNLLSATFTSGNNEDTDNDYGFYPNMSIGSTVFFDQNEDGISNGAEAGISGVTVEVYRDEDVNGFPDGTVALQSATTDSTGSYFFSGLNPGKYVVVIPTSAFESSLLSSQTSSKGSDGDSDVDGTDKGIQSSSGMITYSPTIELKEGDEPIDESGVAGSQDDSPTTLDANGNMTVDFGFFCGTEVFATVNLDKTRIRSEDDEVKVSITLTTNDLNGVSNFSVISYYKLNGSSPLDRTALSPVFIDGDLNGNDTLEIDETWEYGVPSQTFNYTRGDVVTYFLVVNAGGCKPLKDTTTARIRTFGTNSDIQIAQGCFDFGDTVKIDLVARLLIDEDFEKNPTDVLGNPISKVRYESDNFLLKISSLNNNQWFDPFNPPAGVNIVPYTDQNGVDSGRVTTTSLDECEPIETERARPAGSDLDINGQFPDWRFSFDFIVPQNFNFDTFEIIGSDSFDVYISEETGVGTDVFVRADTIFANVFTDGELLSTCRFDFGDASQTYGTQDTVGTLFGAKHKQPKLDTNRIVKLGNLIDYEDDAQSPGVAANGDDAGDVDDEDGWLNNVGDTFVFNANEIETLVFGVMNNTGETAFLNVFIDINNNDTFDASEALSATVSPIADSLQEVSLSFTVPALVPFGNNVTVRARVSTNSGLGSTDIALDGEVEDYGQISAVPVEFISLNARLINTDDVLITWATATELNNRGFEVQRRMEGQTDFETIGYKEGSGNSISTTEYEFIDNEVRWNTPIAYYRLKQEDVDGAYEYSPTVAVSRDGTLEAIVYPNPTKSNTSISVVGLTDGQDAVVRITDMFGKDVSSYLDIAQQGDVFQLSTANLRNGTYFIEVTVEGKSVTKKLVIAK